MILHVRSGEERKNAPGAPALQNEGGRTMTEMMNRLKKIGIIPVVVLNDAKDALPLG